MTSEVGAAALGRPDLSTVVSALVRRMGASDRPVTSVQLELDDAARHALADLLGLDRTPPTRYRLRVAALTAALGVDGEGLRKLLEDVAGPIGNRSADRQAAREDLATAVAAVESAATPLGPAGAAWAARAVRALPGPVGDRLDDVLGVVGVVGTERFTRQPLAVVAAEAFGDPHALDFDSRAGELLGGCCAAAAGLPAPAGAEAWRTALATAGIVADELSSSVTAWAVRPQADHPLAGALAEHTAVGEPAVWTLSMLRRWPITQAPDRVLVVENPAVVAVAAAQLFDGSVVCSAGRPSVAVSVLLAQLAAAGARIDVHADLDEAGLGIVSAFTAAGYQPWCMSATDYLAVLDRSAGPRAGLDVPPTPWDPALAAVYREQRRPVYEEQILDVLLT